MPEISRFYGIRITINWRDHAPPHFHAEHGASQATVLISTGEIMDGSLPKTAARLVKEWAAERRELLQAAWDDAQNHRQPRSIAPLE
jgi:hypothetical protein